MGSIPSPDPAAEGINPANAWAIQTVWLGRVADAVTAELTDRWGDTLAAVDTFTPATVEALAVSLFTDAPVNLPSASPATASRGRLSLTRQPRARQAAELR